VRLRGALGAAIGVIVIGTVATLRSTTIIITIRTTISTATLAAKDKVIGSTIRNIAGMRPMGTGKQRISSGVRALVARAALVIAQAAELGRDPVAAELEHDPVAAELGHDLAVVEPEHDPAVVEPEHDPVAVEPEHDPVAVEPEHDPVAVEPEHDQAVAELAPGHPPGQPGVVPRTKSVTAAHRRDLVLRLAAEDLAAEVAGTTREPAAAEAVIAWEVAE
jgi:hypothetical protein